MRAAARIQSLMNKHVLSLTVIFVLSSLALAQDPSLLRPPKGSSVAIVVFEDLQCPKCRTDSPLEEQAAKTHKVPLVRHDFPLPMHNWSYKAAILARYFDTHSKELGDSSATTSSSTSQRSFRTICRASRRNLRLTTKSICPS